MSEPEPLNGSRASLVGIVLVLIVSCTPPTPTATTIPATSDAVKYWPTEDWRMSTPEQQGMDSEPLATMFDTIRANNVNIFSVLVVRNGFIVTEAYFHPFSLSSSFPIYSCTKSIVSALIGIAIQESLIDGVDQHILDFFPGREFANMDERKRAMTIKDLLTMASGLDWPEWAGPYDPGNIVYEFVNSPDSVQFVLNRPMAENPGAHFNYNSGGSHLLSAILQQATGMDTREYAETRLFNPLGIANVSWPRSQDGIVYGGSGLMLTTRDMAKFGYLYLRQGVWNGQQLVPAAWVDESTRKQIDAVDNSGYGFQWWRLPIGGFAARGWKGQYIFVVPKYDLVVVFTSELSVNEQFDPLLLMAAYVLPSVESSEPLPNNAEAYVRLQRRMQEVGLSEPSISGRKFELEANPFGWRSFVLRDFRDNQAQLALESEQDTLQLPIALGRSAQVTLVPKMGTITVDSRVALKGTWLTFETFAVDLTVLGSSDTANLSFTFQSDKVEVKMTWPSRGISEIVHGVTASQ